MTASLDTLLGEHAELERALADPSVHGQSSSSGTRSARIAARATIAPATSWCARPGLTPLSSARSRDDMRVTKASS